MDALGAEGGQEALLERARSLVWVAAPASETVGRENRDKLESEWRRVIVHLMTRVKGQHAPGESSR